MAANDDDDGFAAHLRGFGPIGLVAILIVLAGNFVVAPLTVVLVLMGTHFSHARREIGYVRPKSWAGTSTVAVLFAATFKLLTQVIVMPLLGAPPINQAYHYPAGNTGAMAGMILVMIVVTDFGEQTVYRGCMLERLGKIFGAAIWAKVFIDQAHTGRRI